MLFRSERELLSFTKNIIGKSFAEIDKYGLLNNKRDKGRFGKTVETGFYGYPTNNDAQADFYNLGIELKVAGFKRNINGSISSKERISLGMIDYCEIIYEDFEFSKLVFKNQKILILWYEYEYGKNKEDFTIQFFQLYDMVNDINIIEEDFYSIKQKVIEGKAHELSEGDTSFLGAATKGSKGQRIGQPYSIELAKPRCFSLKQSYVTGLLRESFIDIPHEYGVKSVIEYVEQKLKPYFGMSQLGIWNYINESSFYGETPKQLSKMISDRIIGKDNELDKKSDLFNKTRYIIKNIPIDSYGYPLERLSFRNLVISEFEDSWEDSDWKSFFEEVTIILICYEGKGLRNGNRILKGVKKLTFTGDDIDLFEMTYNMVQSCIWNRDIKLLPYPYKFSRETLVIAPKGNTGDDVYNNFFVNNTTKTCFMLDKAFINNKINN